MKKLLGVILIILSLGSILAILSFYSSFSPLLWMSGKNDIILVFSIFSVFLYITFIINGVILSKGIINTFGFYNFSFKEIFIGLIKMETILGLLYFIILIGTTYTTILGIEPWHFSKIFLSILYLYFIVHTTIKIRAWNQQKNSENSN